MKQLFLVLGLSIASFQLATSQNSGEVISKNFIEVTGTSETEVTPDEIYITITLQERMDGKDKITIDKQETDLKKNIKDLGIDLSNLTLNSANADYGKVRRSTKDVLINKSYLLKINGADILSKVYERLDKINAYDAYISRYTHSKILEYQKENRVKALTAAKDKVDYLLAALNQKAGMPMQIMETDNYVQDQPQNLGRMAYKNAVQSMDLEMSPDNNDISFKKIKIRSSFIVKYEILNK